MSNPATEAQDLENGTLGDINAITAVGGSNKTDEATIGKFGVGFKAVFQYTATPHIYDPDVFFKIERFIVPIRIDEDYPGRRTCETPLSSPLTTISAVLKKPMPTFENQDHRLPAVIFIESKDEFTSGILGLYEKNVMESAFIMERPSLLGLQNDMKP